MHMRVGERIADRRDARIVRAVAAPDEQRVVVEPEHVAPVCRRGLFHPRGDRHARLRQCRLERAGFVDALLLAEAKEDRTGVGDQDRVVDGDRVGVSGTRGVGQDDFCARVGEQLAERRVLLCDRDGVRLTAPAERATG